MLITGAVSYPAILLVAGIPTVFPLVEIFGLLLSTLFRGMDRWHCIQGLWYRRPWDCIREGVANRDRITFGTAQLVFAGLAAAALYQYGYRALL